MDQGFTRRTFLHGSMAAISTAVTMPLFLQDSAFALDQTHGQAGSADDHILVVVQLSGGNDGLNTIVPYRQDAYYRARGGIAIKQNEVLKIGQSDMGFHPALTGLKDLYDDGLLSVVQGVGYPNPNRSHFKSMDIWHTGNTAGQGTGWLGRYFDAECEGEAEIDSNQCVAIMKKAPLAAQGATVQPIAFENEKMFQWSGKELHKNLAKAYEKMAEQGAKVEVANSNEAFLRRTAMDAVVSSDKIRKAAAQQSLASYPQNKLANNLKLIASMIRSGLSTRVYYTSMGGFDTHAGQVGRHRGLMNQYSQSIKAFYNDLKKQGNSSRVTIVTFSEFGRRVKANASGGTDHGTAAPMFVIGDNVNPGMYGKQPSLTKLDKNGDLIYNTDFRSVYASVLDGWMKTDSEKVLKGKYDALPIMKKA